jgi:hypothetical protein
MFFEAYTEPLTEKSEISEHGPMGVAVFPRPVPAIFA